MSKLLLLVSFVALQQVVPGVIIMALLPCSDMLSLSNVMIMALANITASVVVLTAIYRYTEYNNRSK